MARELPTASYVRSILDYDPDTGIFTWRTRPREHFADKRIWKSWNTRFAGTAAGSIIGEGYVYIKFLRVMYLAHRLSWLYTTGEWPVDQIDHINMDRTDNRFCNLREATSSENRCNKGIPSRNTSGFKGVSWNKQYNKWNVQIKLLGKTHYIGRFDKLDEAAAAYAKAAVKYHGEFARVS